MTTESLGEVILLKNQWLFYTVVSTIFGLSLMLANWFSPKPWQISGNGFHPIELTGIFFAVATGTTLLGGMLAVIGRSLSTMRRAVRWAIAVFGFILTTTILIYTGIEYYDWVGTFSVDYRFATAPQYALPYFLTRVSVWLGAAVFVITVVALQPGGRDDPSN